MVFNQAIDGPVIHIYLQEFLNKIFTYSENYAGEYNGCILKPKWHDSILETAPLSDKCSLMAILLRNPDLVVSRKAICEGIYLVAAYTFQDFIYKRGQEWIMYTCIIQLYQIDTNVDFTSLLMLDHHRAYPLRFFYRFNDPNIEHPIELSFHMILVSWV